MFVVIIYKTMYNNKYFSYTRHNLLYIKLYHENGTLKGDIYIYIYIYT